ncbi:MAG: ArnT family glycosyltransferase [Chitinophagales bacterium]
MKFLKKNILPLFFLSWFLINLLQARATELFDDEAYYWVYSKFLAWGYYDHPPMIALLIKIGYAFFHNELGVRLLIVILSTASLVIIYDLLPQKNKKLFIGIVCSIAILQIGGIIAVPDIPLIFFTALFFWLYRRFLQKASLFNALLLGLGMALLLYSKYHGVLIILFTILSNLKLLRQPLTYVAGLFAAFLFFPHLYWQFVNDFPSVQYHLFERSASAYKISFTADYLAGQILLAGPLMGWLLLWQSFRYKPVDLFERALKFSLAGIYIFFLVMTIKGRVEANWTTPALVPMIILGYMALLRNDKWKNILWKSVPITLVLVFALRVYMALDIAPLKWMPKDEFHQNKKFASLVKEKAGDLPVVFINSYQKTSKYWFYTGNKAFSLNTPLYRRNNFNYWPTEDSLRGKRVYAVIFEDSTYFPDILQQSKKATRGREIDSFYSYSKISLLTEKKIYVTGNKLQSTLHIASTTEQLPVPLTPYLYVYRADTFFVSYKMIAEPVSGYWNLHSLDYIDLPKGKYAARFAIPSIIPNIPSLNSTYFKLIVE